MARAVADGKAAAVGLASVATAGPDDWGTMVDRCTYAGAREVFEAARGASADAERISRRLGEMRAAEGLRGAGPPGPHAARRDVNGMSRTEARVDYERRVANRRRSDLELVDRAAAVIYGGPRGGGVEALLGPAVADAMWWRYCAAATWAEVGRECCVGERWARRACDAAIDTCDAYGMWGMVEGVGVAQES